MGSDLRIQDILSRAESEFRFEAVRSRGPGGQNVNKVSSAAQLHWHLASSRALSPEEKNRLHEKLANWINKAGELYLHSDLYRDLERNKQSCRDRLGQLLRKAFFRPKPRKATKPTRASKERKLTEKKKRGEIKKLRGSKISWD